MMKWLAILFGILGVVIIVLADAGTLPRYLGPVYDFPNGDKVGHFLLYGILVFLIDLTLFQALPPSSSLGTRRKLLAVKCGLILALIITVEEFSQQYFPHRTFDLIDLTFSYLGVIFFSWLALKIKK